ncbi:MAG: TetR/AcrR family transcriptional regulator [Acidimicrobiales bacterium]
MSKLDAAYETDLEGGAGSGLPSGDGRREQMLIAALRVIVERGFADTRIADVAKLAGASPALVIYYFKTKDRLLAEAISYSEDRWYAEGQRRTSKLESAVRRLEEIVSMTCTAETDAEIADPWVLWLDLWAAAARHDSVRRAREAYDEHWRETIREIVRQGQASGEFGALDVDDFAIGFSALLDGLAVQIALSDPVVSAERAFELSMRLAADQLGFSWSAPGR